MDSQGQEAQWDHVDPLEPQDLLVDVVNQEQVVMMEHQESKVPP